MIIWNRKDMLREARRIEGIAWVVWEIWKDSPNAIDRQVALAAKTYGICTFDRIVRKWEHLV